MFGRFTQSTIPSKNCDGIARSKPAGTRNRPSTRTSGKNPSTSGNNANSNTKAAAITISSSQLNLRITGTGSSMPAKIQQNIPAIMAAALPCDQPVAIQKAVAIQVARKAEKPERKAMP
ncbi:hypothetical protein D9M69_671450 [compost metagenome]